MTRSQQGQTEVSVGKKHLGTKAQKNNNRFFASGCEPKGKLPEMRLVLQADVSVPVPGVRRQFRRRSLPNLWNSAASVPEISSG
jgi:hypothetical protein